MALGCNVLSVSAVVLAVISLAVNWYRFRKQLQQSRPPKRTPEFLRVAGVTESEQQRFDHLQMTRDLVTEETYAILEALGDRNSSKFSQLFAICMEYAERIKAS